MRLEQHDSYLKRFDSRVVALAEWRGKPWLTLEQSAFYPTSGGQAHDTGHLRGEGGSALVVEVRVEDGRVWHRVDRNPFASGAQVEGELDWQRRYRHMQRHSGQHLLSQALLRVDEAFETRSVSPTCSLLLPGIAVDRPAIEKPIKKPLQPLRRGLHRPRLPIPP